MTSKSQQSLTAPDMTSRVKGRPPSTLAVDWSILLEHNPPPGFRAKNQPTSSKSLEKDFNVSEIPTNQFNLVQRSDDKVCEILRNILQQLEKDIKDEKNRLKETRRVRRRERARSREARKLVTTDMSRDAINSRRQFRTASPGFGFSNSLTDDKMRKRMHALEDLKRSESFKLSNLRTRSLDRRYTKSFHISSLGEDWSRYSRDSNDLDDSKDLTDSWNVQSVDLSLDSSKPDTDSDNTIENGNSDTENASVDDKRTSRKISLKYIPNVSNSFCNIDNVNTSTPLLTRNNKFTISSIIGQQCRSSNGTSDIKLRKQVSDLDMFPSIKRNMDTSVDDVGTKYERQSRFCLNGRSNSVDVCLGLHDIGQHKYRSEDEVFTDLSPVSPITNSSVSTPMKRGKGKTAPFPKPPRKRSLDQRKTLVRQKPVNNVESFLMSENSALSNPFDLKKPVQEEILIEHGVTSVNDVTSGYYAERSHGIAANDSPRRMFARARRARGFAEQERERSQSMLSIGTSGYSTDEYSLKVKRFNPSPPISIEVASTNSAFLA